MTYEPEVPENHSPQGLWGSYNQGSWDTDLSLVLPLEPAHDDFIVHARCHPVHFTQAKSGPCEYFYIK
jgi:hypothetical protein